MELVRGKHYKIKYHGKEIVGEYISHERNDKDWHALGLKKRFKTPWGKTEIAFVSTESILEEVK